MGISPIIRIGRENGEKSHYYWRRLTNCPECRYDLRGLPDEGRCPECGFEYDERSFAIPVWETRFRPRFWEVPLFALIVFGSANIFFTVTLFGVKLLSGLLGLSAFAALITTAHQYLLKYKGRTDTMLIVAPDGAALTSGDIVRRWRRWSDTGTFRLRRRGRHTWRLRVSRRGARRMQGSLIDVLFRGDVRHAAAVRREIRYRINAVHRLETESENRHAVTEK